MRIQDAIKLLKEVIEIEDVSCFPKDDALERSIIMTDLENKLQEMQDERHKRIKKAIDKLQKIIDQEDERYWRRQMILVRVLPGNKIKLPRAFVKKWKIKDGQFVGMPRWNEKVLIVPAIQPTKNELKEMKQVE